MKRAFWLIGAGVLSTMLVLCSGLFFLTQSIDAVLGCVITAAVLGVWGFIFVRVVHNRMASFTEEVCQTIDEMMQERAVPRLIFDDDTMFDRISHQLSRLYQMLRSHQQRIEEQQADLQGMVSDISHQVKTPMTNLKMAAETLIEQEFPRCEQIEYLQAMNIQLDKLDFLMRTMIQSSRLETGVIALEKQMLSVYETLARALGSIFLKAEEKQLQVIVNCPSDLCVPHDPKWTAEALFNILENAVKYTPSGGSIRVSAVRWEAYTRISIADTGRGIPESAQGAVFRRFYRAPEVHNTEGIGIGLYLAREIIAKQGGHIEVKSAVGKGSAFTVYLPNDFSAEN